MSRSSIAPAHSAKISNLGFVFALFVVAGHIAWIADGRFGQVMVCLWVRTFARVSVPFYFLASGFFLAAHFQDSSWWRCALGKRVKTLLVPYVLWLTVYALAMLALTGQWVVGLGGYGLNLCRMPMMGALWYVRCLMIFVLISPLLKFCVGRWGIGWLLAAYLANVAVSVLTGCGVWEYESGLGGLLGYGISVEGVVYFSLGIYLQNHRMAVKPVWALASLLFGLVLAGVRIACELHGMPLFIHPSVLITPFLLLGCWYLVPSANWPRSITSCTFPVYLTHGIVLAAFWVYYGPCDAVGQWIALALGIALPVALSIALRRLAPRVAAFAFGSR